MTETKAIYMWLDALGLSNMIKLFLGKLSLGVEIKYPWIKNKYPVKNTQKGFYYKNQKTCQSSYMKFL